MEYPPETGGGGIGSYVASIAPALADRGHAIHILSCVEGQKLRDYEEDGVQIHRRGLIYLPGLARLKSFLKIPNTATRFKTGLSAFIEYRRLGVNFDVVEIPDWGAEGWLFAFLHTKPLVAHLHTPLPLIRKYNKQPINRDVLYSSFMEAYSVNRSDLITSSSNILRDELSKIGWLRGSSVEVLSYPIDCHKWNDIEPVQNTEPIVLFLGRLEQRKAPELVVNAFSKIKDEIPQAKVLFVGRANGQRDGVPYNDWVKKIAGNDKQFQFINQVPRYKLKEIFSKSRVLVMPSWFDSFGLVAAEAMASGRPVVVSETSGVSELVKFAKGGRVVPPGNPQALAEALLIFLKDSEYAKKVGERAKSAVQKLIEPSKIAARREVLYQKSIDKFKLKWSLKTRGFPYAIPKRINNFLIPVTWRKWLVGEVVDMPFKHFYFHTARQLLEMICEDSSFANLTNLRGVKVLDVGCTPAVSVLLACLGAEVILLDIEMDELNKGNHYARLLGVQDRVKCVKADAFKIPFNRESFDIVWNSGFIEHFDNPIQILEEMGRVVMPEMPLIVLVPNKWTLHSLLVREHLRRTPGGYYWDFMGRERSYSGKDLVRLLQITGFSVSAKSCGNIRRSFLDDILFLPRFKRMIFKNFLFKVMNFIDLIEKHIKIVRPFGFMVGALAKISSSNKQSSKNELQKNGIT
jgi:glycosyltransferase involved in cell wall biosynthesis